MLSGNSGRQGLVLALFTPSSRRNEAPEEWGTPKVFAREAEQNGACFHRQTKSPNQLPLCWDRPDGASLLVLSVYVNELTHGNPDISFQC